MGLVTLHRLWEEGYTIAAHQLGKAYQDGLGISIDRKAAAEWFQKSAEAGNTCSAYALGKLLLEQEQFPQALHWLRQASGAERSIRAIPARQAAAHRRGRCAEGYRCGHSASEGSARKGIRCPIHAGKALFAGTGGKSRPRRSSALFRTGSGTGQHLRSIFH